MVYRKNENTRINIQAFLKKELLSKSITSIWSNIDKSVAEVLLSMYKKYPIRPDHVNM